MLAFGRCFAICLTLLLLPLTSFANEQTGYAWLVSQQGTDGSIATTTDLANSTQSTYEALVLGRLAGAGLTIDKGAAQTFLQTLPYVDTETVSQALLSGITQTPQGQSLALLLQSRQNTDGGFGHANNYQSTPFDTYWAMSALDAAGQLGNSRSARSVAYLLARQSAAGSWAYQGDASYYLTARVFSLLQKYTAYSGVNTAIASSKQLLLGQVDPSTQLVGGDLFNSALALIALADSGDVSQLKGLAAALLAQQGSDGSWAGDSWTTALVLQALLKNNAASQGAGVAQVSGRVVISASSQPLAGVTVSVIGQTGLQTVTGADGVFVLASVKAGSVNLAFSRSGYNPVSQGTTVQTGEQKNMGDVPMAPGAGVVLLTGTVVDDATTLPIANAAITVIAGTTLTTQSDAKGVFALTVPVNSSYQVTVAATGYRNWQNTVSLIVGQNLLRVGLLANGAVLDNQPGTIQGRIIDGTSGAAIAGAQISVAGQNLVGAADGRFSVANVARGNIAGVVSATGYQAITFTYPYVAGSSGAMGDIALYATSTVQAPTQTTLHLQVTDAVTRLPLSGAQVVVGSANTTSDNSGQAVITGITSNSLTIAVSATGYLATQGQLAITGFGDVYTSIALTPQGPPATQTTLTGEVTDLGGNAIAGATVTVPGTTISGVSDANGLYTLTGIQTLDFVVHAEATGYLAFERSVQVQAFGQYTANLTLQSATGQLFTVQRVAAPATTITANQNVTFTAVVQNLSGQAQTALVRGLLFDVNGQPVGVVPVYAPGTQTTVGPVNFAANAVLTLSLPWNSMQTLVGGYTLRVDVVQPDSISRDLPNGIVWASGATGFGVADTVALSGGFAFNPPMSQAGTKTPVAMSALIQNTGNDVLQAGTYQLTVRNAAGVVLTTVTATGPDLPVNALYTLDFGSWLPTDTGNLSVVVQKTDTPAAGQVTGTYYVGDVASGNLTLDQNVFAEGSHTTQAHINLQGVDVTQGASTDPLYGRVRDALTKAGKYAGPATLQWQRAGNCMGCHIQAQTLYGLSSAQDKAPIDKNVLNAIYNSVAGNVSASHGNSHTHGYWAVTPTSFALWSLDKWPDRAASYKTRVKALSFLWNNRTSNGNMTYINPDYDTGWIRMSYPETVYSAIVPAINDLIADKNTLDATAKHDYALSSALATFPGKQVQGTTASGTDVYIARTGGIDKYDTVTGTLTTVYQDNTGTVYYGVVVDNGAVYATSSSAVIRVIDPTTAQTVLTLGGNYGLRDIVKWNGAFYVADTNNNQILRLDASGPDVLVSTVFVAGGDLGQPVGLTVGDSNQLVVVNKQYHQIVSYQLDGSHKPLFDGLVMPPYYITYVAQENCYYFTTNLAEGYAPYGPTLSGSAVYRGRLDGTVDRLAENDFMGATSYYGVAYAGGSLYVDNVNEQSLQMLQQKTLDDSVVDSVAASIPAIVNEVLLQPRYDDYIVLTAQRMFTLSKLRPLVTDPAQLASLDDTVATLNTYLRSKQRADGGWAHFNGYPSDAAATAWVGLALDTLNPSANDPVVVNSIQYLLNNQSQAEGTAWSPGYVFSQSILGPTGLVMAYLPSALERLGGLDVNLDLQSRPDVQLSGFSIPPASTTPQADGSQLFHWSLDGVTVAGRQINFTAAIANLQLGEVRPVATSAALQFRNSFTNEILTRNLQVPTVSAINGVTLNVTTDSSLYPANATVTITDLFANTGLDLQNVVIKSVIRTAGGVVIAGLPDQTGLVIVQSGSGQTAATWNTGTAPAGNYQVFAQLLDANGRVRAESTAAFAIGGSDGTATLPTSYATQISTDKLLYKPFDSVQLHSRVRNLTVNAGQAPVLAKLVVTNPAGTSVFSKQWVVPAMAANGLLDFADTLPLHDAAPGAYSVSLQLWDADLQNVLATSQYGFSVTSDALAYLTGSVTVSAPQFYVGQSVSCTDRIENRSSTQSTDAGIETVLLRAADQTVISDNTTTQHFAAGQVSTTIRTIDSSPLTAGDYSCVLLAHSGARVSTLGFANFKLIVPPVNLDVKATFGLHGRLLVLLDDPRAPLCKDDDGHDHSNTGDQGHTLSSNQDDAGHAGDAGHGDNPDHDSHGDSDGSHASDHECCPDGHAQGDAHADEHSSLDRSTAAAQDTYLRGLLDTNGWSYTIVYTAADFAREFQTGRYSEYALLSEKVSLLPQTEAAVLQAVNNGDGLVIAGEFNRRNNQVEETLGIKITGNAREASGLLLPAGSLATDWPATTVNPLRKLDIDKTTATVIADFVVNDHDHDQHCSTDDHNTDEHNTDHGKPRLGHSPAPNKFVGLRSIGNKPVNIKDSEDHSGDDQKAGSECGTPALDAALTIHTYGKGKAVFAAFDPLDEATFAATPAAPYGNAYARVLTYLFAAAQPAAPLAIAGKDTPVQVNVTNKGVAADVRISVTATAVDMAMPGWQLVGNEWQYSTTLAVNAVASAPVLYVPYTNPLAINMRVETRLPGSDWTPYPQSPFNLVVTP